MQSIVFVDRDEFKEIYRLEVNSLPHKFLFSYLFRFNKKNRVEIGLFNDEILSGDLLKNFLLILEELMSDLINDCFRKVSKKESIRYVKIDYGGKKLEIDYLGSDSGQLIYFVHYLIKKVKELVEKGGELLLFGLGDLDERDFEFLGVLNRIYSENDSNLSLEEFVQMYSKYSAIGDGHVDKIIGTAINNLEKKKYLEVVNSTEGDTKEKKIKLLTKFKFVRLPSVGTDL